MCSLSRCWFGLQVIHQENYRGNKRLKQKKELKQWIEKYFK